MRGRLPDEPWRASLGGPHQHLRNRTERDRHPLQHLGDQTQIVIGLSPSQPPPLQPPPRTSSANCDKAGRLDSIGITPPLVPLSEAFNHRKREKEERTRGEWKSNARSQSQEKKSSCIFLDPSLNARRLLLLPITSSELMNQLEP